MHCSILEICPSSLYYIFRYIRVIGLVSVYGSKGSAGLSPQCAERPPRSAARRVLRSAAARASLQPTDHAFVKKLKKTLPPQIVTYISNLNVPGGNIQVWATRPLATRIMHGLTNEYFPSWRVLLPSHN